jgi:hypothetical protein
MLTELQIQALLNSVVGELKKSASANSDFYKFLEDRGIRMDEKKKPKASFYPEYYANIKAADKIRVHAEQDIFPSELFIKRAPNMTKEEYEYVEQNYQQITLPVFVDYINTLLRAFSDDNWSIKYQKDDAKFKEDETLEHYLEHGIKNFGSLENHLKNIVVPVKAVDAPGIIAVDVELPFVPQLNEAGEQVYEDEKPVFVVDDSVLLEPQPVYHSCANILAFDEDRWYFVLSEEKAVVKEGDKDVKKGFKFILYDQDIIWHINQIGQYSDYEFEYIAHYEHNWGRVPVIRLKGLPKIYQGRITWISPFSYVTDTLNLALLDSTYLFCSKAKCVFPYLVTIGYTCEYEDSTGHKCTEGIITTDKGNVKCPSCGGTGTQSRISPIGQLNLRPGNSLDNPDPIKPTEAMAYVAPGTETLEFLRKEIDNNLSKARDNMHLFTSNTLVKGQENMTATGMGIDLKAMYAFIKPISDQVFTIYEFLIDAIGFFRYTSSYKKPVLTYPATFDFNTEQDYLFNIGEAKKAGLPPAVIHQAIIKYLQAIYSNEEITSKIFKLVDEADRLLVLSDSEIQIKFNKGLAERWEVILHDSIFILIKQLQRENEGFLDLALTEQITLLNAKAKAIADAMKSPVDTFNNSLVENIAAA